jgi:FtsZ-binding cell division protein ZapB
MTTPVDPPTTGVITEYVAVISAAAVAMLLGAQRAIKAFGESRSGLARDSAQTEIVNELREELNRLVEQNGKMADAINLMQMEVVALRGENADLHTTVRSLHAEVRRLRRAGATSDFGALDATPN